MDDDDRRHGGVTHYPLPPYHAARRQRGPSLAPQARPRRDFRRALGGDRYKAAGKLLGRAALVTVGDTGLGRAVAALYAREGADIALVYRPDEQADAQQTQRLVERAGRRCLLLPGSVCDARFCEKAVEATARELGGLDVLVNDASDAYGCLLMARSALRVMKSGASIVNASAEGAVAAFTASLARSVARRRIRVNGLAFGAAGSARPEELAPAFVFFANEAESGRVTGQTLLLTGAGASG